MAQFTNAPDVKNESGAWIRSYRDGTDRYHTRGGVVWNSVLTRCKPTGTGAYNGFESFQDFMDWATSEHGYGLKDSGGLWHLDKDILIYGNKTYSKDSCVFVPQSVNKLVLENPLFRGDLPIGVSISSSGKYRARCKQDGKEIHLGVYDSPEQAHLAWLYKKKQIVQEVINKPELSEHHKLLNALACYMEILEDIK